MKKVTKLLSALIAAAMLLAVLGLAVFAEENAATVTYEGGEAVGYATAQEAVDAVVNSEETGNITITLLADPAETVVIKQQEGKNLTITADAGVVVTSSLEVDGDGRHSKGEETITFDNIVFSSTKAINFITSQKQYTDPGESAHNSYPHNIFIKNCTVTGSPAYSVVSVVLAHFTQYYNLTMENCVGTQLHSLLQSQSMGGQGVIRNCTVTNSKSGISLGTSANYTVTDTTIEAKNDYGIRFDVNGIAADLKIENCSIKAPKPLVTRNTATNPVSVTVSECNIASTWGEEYPVLAIDGSSFNPAGLVTIDLNKNYWGGGSPVISADFEDVEISAGTYYTDEEKTQLTGNVLLDKNGDGVYGEDEIYASVKAAYEAAEPGDTIVLNADITLDLQGFGKQVTIDLNNKTLTLDKAAVFEGEAAQTTFKNGAVNFDNCDAKTNHYMGDHQNVMKFLVPVVFDNVKMRGENVTAGGAVFSVGANGEMKMINGSTLDIISPKATACIEGAEQTAKITIENSVLNLNGETSDGLRGILRADVAVSGSELTIANMSETALRNVSGVIEEQSTVTIDGGQYGVKNTGSMPALQIDNSEVTISNTKNDTDNSGIYLEKGDALVIAGNSIVNAEIYVAPRVDDETGESNLAKTIKLTFSPTASANVYDIYVEATDGGTINRLSALQVKFALNMLDVPDNENKSVDYTLAPAKGVTISNDINDAEAYLFHYEPDKTGAKFLLGNVTFGGYGEFTFGVDETYPAKAMTAEMADNIVAEYVPEPDEAQKQGKFDIVASAVTGLLSPVTADLTVKIAFNNNVTAGNAEAYQQMKVTITGADGKEYVYALGGDNYTAEEAVIVAGNLPANNRYTVTVSGEGYRTAKKTVQLTEAGAELAFWNNVKDTAEANGERKNFLAGEIVKDGKINVYDLSAVVSYFGEIDLDNGEKNEYAKYDLNRDGKVDSKDVAMVLVSWNE